MKRTFRLTAVLAVCAGSFALIACNKTGDLSKSTQVLARVGDKEITSAYFERQLSELPDEAREQSSQGPGKRAVLEGLVNRELLYAQALKKNLDEDAEVLKKFEDLKKELIIKTLLQRELAPRVAVDDREVENYYNNNPGEFKNREEVRISQIVVADQQKADEIMEKLSIKRDFAELAASNSIDGASAARNGDVGWFTKGKLPREVSDELFRLEPGGVSRPHKIEGRYEIYRVTDRRSGTIELDKVKELIRTQILADKTQKEINAMVAALKKDTVVQLNEQLLK